MVGKHFAGCIVSLQERHTGREIPEDLLTFHLFNDSSVSAVGLLLVDLLEEGWFLVDVLLALRIPLFRNLTNQFTACLGGLKVVQNRIEQ